jgi:hypothetical protein
MTAMAKVENIFVFILLSFSIICIIYFSLRLSELYVQTYGDGLHGGITEVARAVVGLFRV